MHNIIKYFVQNFEYIHFLNVSTEIRQQITKLDRGGRGELLDQLFERAKSLEQSKSKEQLIGWLQACFRIIDNYSFRFNNVYFSPGTEIKATIVNILREAQSTLDLCVFTISDKELADQILACHRQKVKVRIITDDEKIRDEGSEIYLFEQNGIEIKIDHSHYRMHNKFGIIDNRIAITGSFNWTYTATKHNQENLLATSNYDIVKQYQNEFNRLWNEMFEL
jgi:cardiolipin hydrolase